VTLALDVLGLKVLLRIGISQVGILTPVATSWLCAYDLHRRRDVNGRSILYSALTQCVLVCTYPMVVS
jgi:hypothetical protein